MSRPEIIPVCRLHHGLPRNHVTLWRRAEAGLYGRVVRDERGRKAVSLEAVEIAEGVTFTDQQIAAMLNKPRVDLVYAKKKQERLRKFTPFPTEIELPEGSYSAAQVRSLIFDYCLKRDVAWHRYLAMADRAYADLIETTLPNPSKDME